MDIKTVKNIQINIILNEAEAKWLLNYLVNISTVDLEHETDDEQACRITLRDLLKKHIFA